MEYKLPYGKRSITFSLTDDLNVDYIETKQQQFETEQTRIVKASLENPYNTEKVENIINGGDKICIVVPDKTRKCGLKLVLHEILKRLSSAGVPAGYITILIANGSHSFSDTNQEKIDLVGKAVFKRYKVYNHNCLDEKNLVYLGKTSRRTPVTVNKIITDSTKIITIGGVLPHYFAGFGGGPKLMIPGCAGYETIRKNHSLTIDPKKPDLHPMCNTFILKGNPVQEDIKESVEYIKVDFSVNTVLNSNNEIIFASSGDLYGSHKPACEMIEKLYKYNINHKYDLAVVSCGGFPKDINVIQAHKTIYNIFPLLKDNGTMIVIAECSEGLGSKSFTKLIDISSVDFLHKQLTNNFEINGNTIISLKKKSLQKKIFFISQLSKNFTEKIGMTPVENIDSAIDIAFKRLHIKSKICIIPYGYSVII